MCDEMDQCVDVRNESGPQTNRQQLLRVYTFAGGVSLAPLCEVLNHFRLRCTV
jgi:hypothetical protein